MSMNELFHCHQMALIAASNARSTETRAAAAQKADEIAYVIRERRPANSQGHAVLSAKTLLAIQAA